MAVRSLLPATGRWALDDDAVCGPVSGSAWSALDERQLIRLLTDSAPVQRAAPTPADDPIGQVEHALRHAVTSDDEEFDVRELSGRVIGKFSQWVNSARPTGRFAARPPVRNESDFDRTVVHGSIGARWPRWV
ncbi:hypothetical protein EAH80_30085 [Mycobacterium hodleri]|uniref:Uncharacterized protein n=1 Tax=Mycolicibacterium hodleri TaxID=49897 RepID=A0A502DLN6_9MYCO|nr:hypothetical protein EAH80_30085 [Mycolicibacterium hodleri]